MEEKVPARSTMVSRLPKFGARSSTGGLSPMSNGSPQPTTPTPEGKTTPPGTRPNGVVRTPSFSLKWRREVGGTPTNPSSPEDRACEDKAQSQLPSLGKEVKSGPPGTPKMRRPCPSLLSISSPKAIPKQASKAGPKAGAKLAQSPLNGIPKVSQNASSAPTRPGSMSGSDSRLARPRIGSGTPRSSSQDSLSQSSDSLKSLALDNMVRSHSFTHFKQIPSPTSLPMTRSFSFNRAVELAKPLANTQLRPPRSSFLKPPQLSNGRVGLGLGGLSGSLGGGGGLGGSLGGLQFSRTPHGVGSLSSPSPSPSPSTTPTTPNTMKKALLPSCVLAKPAGSSGGSLGYRLAKQQKPLFTGRVKGDVRPAASTVSVDGPGTEIQVECTSEAKKADLHSDSDQSSGGGGQDRCAGGSVLRERSAQMIGETLEDMSLSSASSLERGDTSEEFVDESDSVGDGLSDGDLPDNTKSGDATQSRLRCFLNETMDWASMALAGHSKEVTVQGSQSQLVLSPEGPDLLPGSSLELSPSNSSGGTYMWDEEGLEPLGGPGAHPYDSYDDSELNSTDILNNLDPLGTGELDEDDLMLEMDLPEDGSLHHDCDGMAHAERSEKAGRQANWRRKQHRLNGGHFHNDNRAPVFQHYDGLGGSLRISPHTLTSFGRQDGLVGDLDELTLKHLAQDCSSLKNQLHRLKTLLQLEDADSPADIPEKSEDNTTALQLEELMKEVQTLREELRSRDKTIAQLTLQCQQLQQQQHRQEQTHIQGQQGRCQCYHQRAPSAMQHGGKQTARWMQHHYDKATQTHWRAQSQAPRILQPFNPCLNEHFQQERLVKTPLTEGHSDPKRRGSRDRGPHINTATPSGALATDVSGAAGTLAPDSEKLSLLLGAHLHVLDHLGSSIPQEAIARDRWTSAVQSGVDLGQTTDETLPNSGAPSSDVLMHPRVLQPPRLHKRVSVPALLPGRASGSTPLKAGCFSGCLGNPRAKQLPPPSRGLPCFNSGPQAQLPGLGRVSLPQARTAMEPLRDPQSSDTKTNNSSQDEPTPGEFRDPGATRVLIPASQSRLPKPKIH
ncbi:LOW QUALITY PROTEIN: serine-rich coiled-coil domain-containing protein 2 [Lampris incognitus]|uniref:LOW QUALITY PROTEIN: serine-rich coiled-coil domain-containing protein 2 n=1 Tax=Lampris incognitus TaxID=2546036 RepID=UPI0024B4CC83|nr:LOW QUALITY PROTEIN: serine-rich coiled-coil domain-containing protein 2 [Lampris incognitus]